MLSVLNGDLNDENKVVIPLESHSSLIEEFVL